MFAIIETGGKQYRVAPDATIRVEKLGVEPGTEVVFDRVLLVSDDGAVKVGTPSVEGAVVKGRVVEDARGPKLIAFKKRRRKDSKKKLGHRQKLSVVEITGIEA